MTWAAVLAQLHSYVARATIIAPRARWMYRFVISPILPAFDEQLQSVVHKVSPVQPPNPTASDHTKNSHKQSEGDSPAFPHLHLVLKVCEGSTLEIDPAKLASSSLAKLVRDLTKARKGLVFFLCGLESLLPQILDFLARKGCWHRYSLGTATVLGNSTKVALLY